MIGLPDHGERRTQRLRTPRSLNLANCMILVAATAIGLGIIRSLLATPEFRWFTLTDPAVPSLVALTRRLMIFYPLLWMWTLAILMICTRGRPANRHRLFRQPGMIACCAALPVTGFAVLSQLIPFACSLKPIVRTPNIVFVGIVASGPAVAAAWGVLYLSGRWRAEQSAIDRIGRALGLCWIAAFFLGCPAFFGY